MDSGSDMVETDLESNVPDVQAVSVALSFGNANGGAWDDRELINAYDAAMDEFHLHHPGPGSWLDKAMAAKKKGQPLEAAKATSSAWVVEKGGTNGSWYSASAPVVSAPEVAVAEPVRKKRKTRNAGTVDRAKTSQAGPSMINPYAANPSTAQRNGTARKSPAYVPPSPPAEIEDVDRQHRAGNEMGEGYDQYANEWYDQSYDLSAQRDMPQHGGDGHGRMEQGAGGPSLTGAYGYAGYGPPVFTPQPTHMISPMEAMGHAMSAQYWAGYWMGVAQAKSSGGIPSAHSAAVEYEQGEEEASEEVKEADDGEAVTEPVPANVLVTKKQFTKPGGPSFRR